MKILAFCTTFWDQDPALAAAKRPELSSWLERVEGRFQADHTFLATGCQDDLRLNPLGLSCVNAINSGEPKTKPYDVFRWSYFLCAFEAALWHAMHLTEIGVRWDLLIEMESNVWVNPKTDTKALLESFIGQPELILAPSWWGRPDFNFLVLKPAALPAFLHHRLRGNLVADENPCPMLAEDEIEEIFRGRWFNPWPEFKMIRQQWGIPENPPHWRVTPDEVAKHWPVVALPSPEIQRLFT